MVEPPATTFCFLLFFSYAFCKASQSTPSCSEKFASSEAMMARFRLFEMRLYGTQVCCKVAFGFFSCKLDNCSRMKEVLPGLWSIHHQICRKKYSCTTINASTGTMNSHLIQLVRLAGRAAPLRLAFTVRPVIGPASLPFADAHRATHKTLPPPALPACPGHRALARHAAPQTP